jgi:plastocyanin
MPEKRLESLHSYRRDVMKAIGAGAVLSGVSGSAMAQQDDDGGTTTDGGGETDDGAEDGGTETGRVHRVETLISGPPTNPERPADFFYQPTGLHVQPGDVVKFVFVTPDHNVVSYHPAFGMRRRMPTGAGPFSSPLLGWRPETIPGDQVEPPAEMGGEGGGSQEGGETESSQAGDGMGPVPDTWLYSFETPGVYDLLCSPHEHFGMAMRVVVGDVTDAPFETSDPANLQEPRAGPVGLARTTLTDPALQPSNIVQQGTVAWESLEANQEGSTETNG